MLTKVDLLCEIVGVDKQGMIKRKGPEFAAQVAEVSQCHVIEGPFPFITRPDYSAQDKEELISFLTELVKCMIGEDNDVSGWQSLFENRNNSRQQRDEGEDDKAPIVIFIDNAQDMCPTSWLFLDNILEECYQVVVILLVQSDDMDRMKIHPQSVQAFEQAYNSIFER